MAGKTCALTSGGLALVCVGALLLASSSPESPQMAVIDASGAATICGTVLQRPWSKTYESWDAGGSDYFVLAMDHVHAAAHPQYGDSIILRFPSDDSVTEHDLARWVSKHACVRGTLLEAQPYVPSYAWEQFPTGMDGRPEPRGSGIRMAKIGRLADVQS
ncbi:hypothetical protein KFE25_007749 [Diacronema lutheri]|uniref:Uncharacterized protein n=1 Tax=Diacronema lutheri TaxID=2081491 RepID=A0A8J5XUH9_DIALT|nr:hypothetical protein KFE25_007749 [Diacronema lutheri]